MLPNINIGIVLEIPRSFLSQSLSVVLLQISLMINNGVLTLDLFKCKMTNCLKLLDLNIIIGQFYF